MNYDMLLTPNHSQPSEKTKARLSGSAEDMLETAGANILCIEFDTSASVGGSTRWGRGGGGLGPWGIPLPVGGSSPTCPPPKKIIIKTKI